MFKDKTRTFQTPGNQQQQNFGMDMEQDNHSEPPIRPIVNIIVPNSRTASILEKGKLNCSKQTIFNHYVIFT